MTPASTSKSGAEPDCCGAEPAVARVVSTAPARAWWRRPHALLAPALAGILLGAAASATGHPALAIVGYLVAVALSVGPPLRRAVRSVRARSLEINTLMVIAVAGALALGEWFEAAMVVWLFGVAQWLEARSLAHARRAIGSLVNLAPSRAAVLRAGRERQTPIDQVRVGDVVLVRPGERIPVDGRVRAGESAVDQAPVTGESWPVEKSPGDAVFAGTINGTGALELDVDRLAADSTIARIIHLVEHAQAQRADVQTFVDRFARRYTPAVVVLAVLVGVIPPVVGLAGGAAVWVYRALALLVVACPCALVISTPVAIVSAITAAARSGVLIKGAPIWSGSPPSAASPSTRPARSPRDASPSRTCSASTAPRRPACSRSLRRSSRGRSIRLGAPSRATRGPRAWTCRPAGTSRHCPGSAPRPLWVMRRPWSGVTGCSKSGGSARRHCTIGLTK